VAPVVLLEEAGGTYWSSWQRFVEEELSERNLINPLDLSLCRVCTNVEDAVEEITGFYRGYHSSRYVGRRLVMRLKGELPDALLDDLNRDFADIISTGRIERVAASSSEIEDRDAVDLPRIAFAFNKASYARLRLLINRINDAEASLPPAPHHPSDDVFPADVTYPSDVQ